MNVKYLTLHLHTNLWYAEYTHEEVIRRFPYVYREILDTLEKFPEIKVGWDIEPSVSIPYLQEVAPDVLNKIKEGIDDKRFEILLDTWSFSLVSLHTRDEFEYQYHKALDILKDTFGTISNGFFAQENAYAETLPKLLTAHGIKFLPIKKETIEMLGYGEFQSNFLTTYALRGHDESRIVMVPFETVYSNLASFVDNKRKTLHDKSIILILGDTEIFSPKELKSLGEYLKRHKDEIKPILLSEYVETHPPIGEIYLPDCTWAIGTNDYFLWCRDPWDHKLWTLNERARRQFCLAKFWFNMLSSEKKQKWKSKLNDGLDLILLGQNSDKFGWNPCPEKRKEGEIEFLNAFYYLETMSALISERIFQENPEKYKINETYAKHFLLVSLYHTKNAFHHLPIPLTFPIKIEKTTLKFDSLALYHESQKVPFTLQNVELEDDYIKIGELSIVMPETFFDKSNFTHLFVHRETPMADASKIGEFITEITTQDNYVTMFHNKLDNFKLHGDLLGYELFLDTELELISRNSSVEKSVPSDLFKAFKIIDEYNSANVLTEFKIYRGVPFVEIFRKFSFKQTTSGRINPLTISIEDSGFKEIFRDIHDIIVKRNLQGIEEATPLINDWCIIKTHNAKLFIAADSTVHSVKEVSVEENQLTFSPIETIYENNPYEHLHGDIVFKVLFGAFPLNTPDTLLINTAQLYSRPVYVIDMIQLEGAKSV